MHAADRHAALQNTTGAKLCPHIYYKGHTNLAVYNNNFYNYIILYRVAVGLRLGLPCADPTNVISAALKWTIWVCMALAAGRARVVTQDTQQ